MDSYSNRPSVLIGVLWTQTALATLITGARFYARLLIEPNVGWDDWTMLIALFLEYAATSILSRSVHFGLGRHQSTISPESARQALEFQWIFQPVQVTSTIIARTSVAIMVIRLFPTKKAMKMFLISVTIVNTVVGVVGFTLIFTQCSPSRKLWDEHVEGHCIASSIQKDVATFKASISALSDLATAVWPIAIVWTLHMKLRKKIFLATLFALTIVAMVCCVVEAVYLTANAVRTDETYVAALSAIWTCTPVNVLIIVGSIPTLPPIYKKFFGSRHSQSSNAGGNRWPTTKKYTHPLDDTNIDIYPLQGQKAITNIMALGMEEGSDQNAVGNSKNTSLSGNEGIENDTIRRTTEVDVQFQPR